MAKGCLITVGIALVFIIIIMSLFTARPATHEEINEILNTNFNDYKDLSTYIELVKFVDQHKKAVLDSISSKDTSTCVNFPLIIHFSYSYQLPPTLSIACDKIASKINNSGSKSLQICKDGSVSLHVLQKDYDNYLYIWHRLYLNDRATHKKNLGYVKEKIIKGKYYYIVEVEDAFNYMDPNNIAPN